MFAIGSRRKPDKRRKQLSKYRQDLEEQQRTHTFITVSPTALINMIELIAEMDQRLQEVEERSNG